MSEYIPIQLKCNNDCMQKQKQSNEQRKYSDIQKSFVNDKKNQQLYTCTYTYIHKNGMHENNKLLYCIQSLY